MHIANKNSWGSLPKSQAYMPASGIQQAPSPWQELQPILFVNLHKTSIYLGFRIVVVNKARYTIQKLLDGLSNRMVAQIIVRHWQIVRQERSVNGQRLYEDNAL